MGLPVLAVTGESIFVLLRGILVGLVIAVPVGPIAILCMRRTLERGPRFGFATGLGAALADGFYAATVAFSIAAVLGFMNHHFVLVRSIGGAFMLVLAVRLMQAPGVSPKQVEVDTGGRTFRAFLSGFVLTASNPMTVVGVFAVLTAVGLGNELRNTDLRTCLVLGVALGSASWWLALTIGIFRLRHRVSEKALRRINQFAALMLGAFGIYAFISVAIRLIHGG